MKKTTTMLAALLATATLIHSAPVSAQLHNQVVIPDCNDYRDLLWTYRGLLEEEIKNDSKSIIRCEVLEAQYLSSRDDLMKRCPDLGITDFEYTEKKLICRLQEKYKKETSPIVDEEAARERREKLYRDYRIKPGTKPVRPNRPGTAPKKK
ncbi:MAG: hypothetical protein SFW63_03825 [Alphaproteobacteria bacterium]|nr:hypothetical protein [Alphaproteobacteria bacterium]